MITISNVTKTFPSVVALDNLTLQIGRQEFFGLLGPNGAGKTTLMSLLVGYLDADSGAITIDGNTVTQANLDIRRKIGFVPQSVALYDDLPAQDNLEIFGSFFNIDKRKLQTSIREQLQAVELYDRRKDLVKTFSGGMKRRLNIVASLLHEPDIIIADEPTVGVDPQSRNAIFDFLLTQNRQGRTIIYTTHYMEEAERLCNRVAIIDKGTILALGTVDELLAKLPYDETILISKNHQTTQQQDLFAQFGELLDHQDHFELKPAHGFTLSGFFARIEAAGVGYQAIELRRPTLEALFLHLTGRRLRD